MAKPFVTIELDKPRKLRFNLWSLKALQDATGLKLSELGAFLAETQEDIEKMATLLWAGLIHEDKDLTVDKLMEIITWDKLSESLTKIYEAFATDMGMAESEEIEKNASRVKNQKSEENGVGTSPSKSPAK